MKKAICLITALVLTVSLMVMSVTAANFGSLADELKGLNLFQGTEAGYELDRAPTRAEAGVMLVRLLGKEEKAKADYVKGTTTNPFADVPDWAAPYVAYLFQNGLVNGTTETTYSPDELCSAQMFCTFALRTLGYSDKAGGDFTYQDALVYAKQVGIVDDLLLSGDFMRDQLAAISYNTLGTSVKGGKVLLLESLMDSGAINRTAAAPILEKLNNSEKFAKAAAAWNNVKAVDMTADIKMSVKSAGLEMAFTMPMDIKAVVNGTDIQLQMNATLALPGEQPMDIQLWMKDGWMYMQQGSDKIKYDLGLDEEALEELTQKGSSAKMPPYLTGNVTIEQKGDDTVYTLTDNGLFSRIFDSAMAGIKDQTGGTTIKVSNYNYTVTVDKNGVLKGITVSYSMSAAIAANGENDLTQDMSMEMNMSIVYTINALGDDVTITFPDFTDFVESPASSIVETPAI